MELQAVVEATIRYPRPVWATSEPPLEGLVRVWRNTTPEQVEAIVLELVALARNEVWRKFQLWETDEEYAGIDIGVWAEKVALLPEHAMLGGIAVIGDGGRAVFPGCCCGLEQWPEWLGLVEGRSPWMGHHPDPLVLRHGERVRVWADISDHERGDPPVAEASMGEVADRLAAVQKDLEAFLPLLYEWALRFDSRTAKLLTDTFDRSFVHPSRR